MTFAGRILETLARHGPMTDRELTDALVGRDAHPSQINQGCRALAARGRLIRQPDSDGRIRNSLDEASSSVEPPVSTQARLADGLGEDEVKEHLEHWLRKQGWDVRVAWARQTGIDIEATRDGARWVIEVKGGGSLQPMRVNYFLAVLGETLQRMDDATAHYSIALPDLAQFRRLWERLPRLAKERTGISSLFVDESGNVRELN